MDRVAAHACFVRLYMPAAAGDKLIDDEGLLTAADLSVLTTERVRDIIASIRKPGGTIPNPAGGSTSPTPGSTSLSVPPTPSKWHVSSA